MFTKTQSMFEYSGLTETLKARWIENVLQHGGRGIITKVEKANFFDDNFFVENKIKIPNPGLYMFDAPGAGIQDLNGSPTFGICVHPYLRESLERTFGVDAVYCRNDSYSIGLSEIIERYSTQLAENECTLSIADILARATALLTAGDDRTQASAQKFIDDIFKGKLGIIGELSPISGMESVRTLPYAAAAGTQIKPLIELQQFLTGSLWHELGVESAYNGKREAIGEAEAGLNEATLLPLPDDMLKCRREFLREMNFLYGTSASVRFSSAWEREAEKFEKIELYGEGDTLEEEKNE